MLERKEEDIKMLRVFSYALIYLAINCSCSTSSINLEDYFEKIVDKEYLIERWDITYEEVDLTSDNIFESYPFRISELWEEKKDISIQVTKTNTEGVIIFSGRTYDDYSVTLNFSNDSLMIRIPDEFKGESMFQIPKVITGNGYYDESFGIEVISDRVIRISVILNSESDSISYWIEKEDGLLIEFSSSEYSKVIGIPSRLSK